MDEPPRDNFNYTAPLLISVLCFLLFLPKRVKAERPVRASFFSVVKVGEAMRRKHKRYFLISGGPC